MLGFLEVFIYSVSPLSRWSWPRVTAAPPVPSLHHLPLVTTPDNETVVRRDGWRWGHRTSGRVCIYDLYDIHSDNGHCRLTKTNSCWQSVVHIARDSMPETFDVSFSSDISSSCSNSGDGSSSSSSCCCCCCCSSYCCCYHHHHNDHYYHHHHHHYLICSTDLC